MEAPVSFIVFATTLSTGEDNFSSGHIKHFGYDDNCKLIEFWLVVSLIQ